MENDHCVTASCSRFVIGLFSGPTEILPRRRPQGATDRFSQFINQILSDLKAIMRAWPLILGCIIPFAVLNAFIALDPQASLELSTPQVKDGDIYSATAKGFTPGEIVKFSWDRGPMADASPADSAGSTTLLEIKEMAPPGTYTLTASGQASRHTATAKIQVVPSGS
jgi:hypothetical protein